MRTIIEGFLLGVTLSVFFSFGPALIALIQTSIHRGFWSGVLLAGGVFLSDVTLVGLGFLGAVKIFYDANNQLLFGIIGGVLLMIFGIVTYRRKVALTVEGTEAMAQAHQPGPLTYIFKGFFINFTNPFVWLFWMGVVVGFTANYQGDFSALLLFFPAALVTIFTSDVLKCFSAYKIKKYIQTHNIIWINRFTGIGLCFFGLYLIIRAFFEWFPA